MLSNAIVGSHKLVLFVDEVGLERHSQKLLENLLIEQNVNFVKFDGSFVFSSATSVILEPISKMELYNDSAAIYSTIQTLKLGENVSQIFCWATSKNINDRLLIPFLEHLCNVLVTVKSPKHLSVLTKRKFGTVKLKEYQHELTQGKTAIEELKAPVTTTAIPSSAVNPETIGTFKIGEFNAEELKAKQNLKLPFELIDLPQETQHKKQEGKIIYTHDSVDDFDEEDDPDNDLIF